MRGQARRRIQETPGQPEKAQHQYGQADGLVPLEGVDGYRIRHRVDGLAHPQAENQVDDNGGGNGPVQDHCDRGEA